MKEGGTSVVTIVLCPFQKLLHAQYAIGSYYNVIVIVKI